MRVLQFEEKLQCRNLLNTVCEGYIFEKKRVSFCKIRKKPKATKFHTDIWGPSTTTSLGGSNYYVTFIYDSSKKIWVYFLKNGSNVFDAFKRLKVVIENEKYLNVKFLESDNGREYLNNDFEKYYTNNEIKMKKTIPGRSQQNGVAEKMNKILYELVRSMNLHGQSCFHRGN